jgi:hypothetical protein
LLNEISLKLPAVLIVPLHYFPILCYANGEIDQISGTDKKDDESVKVKNTDIKSR